MALYADDYHQGYLCDCFVFGGSLENVKWDLSKVRRDD